MGLRLMHRRGCWYESYPLPSLVRNTCVPCLLVLLDVGVVDEGFCVGNSVHVEELQDECDGAEDVPRYDDLWAVNVQLFDGVLVTKVGSVPLC